MSNETGWAWWSGRSDEWFEHGPFSAREDAIDEAQCDASGEFLDEDGIWKVGIHIAEARQDPLRVADWIGADWILDRAEDLLCDSERVSSENDDGPWFEVTKEQESDLVDRLKRACDEWQDAHGLVFTCNTFSAMRNAEYVVVPHPSDEDTQ